jgi:hypothetical protein
MFKCQKRRLKWIKQVSVHNKRPEMQGTTVSWVAIKGKIIFNHKTKTK